MAPLSIEDHLAQSSFEASPPKWHLGHTTWFFESLILKQADANYKEFDAQYAYFFNSYYEALGPRLDRAARAGLTRPALTNIHEYRTYVDDRILELLDGPPLSKGILDTLELGLHHEQQHQELFFTDFKKALAQQAFYPIYQRDFVEDKLKSSPQQWLQVAEGIYSIGHQGDGFHFDNEAPQHKVYLNKFEISSRLVNNGEWLEFISAGGYENPEYWLSDGWAWKRAEGIKTPMYWFQESGTWKQFTLAGVQEVKAEHSVKHISYYEAQAFANWRGMRLPTEAEWEVAQAKFEWGERWEWTQSAYLAYPGFKPYSGPAKEYNGKFMVNQMVLRGSSIVSPEGHARPSYRNFFHPQFRWQFTGLRLAKNIA